MRNKNSHNETNEKGGGEIIWPHSDQGYLELLDIPDSDYIFNGVLDILDSDYVFIEYFTGLV